MAQGAEPALWHTLALVRRSMMEVCLTVTTYSCRAAASPVNSSAVTAPRARLPSCPPRIVRVNLSRSAGEVTQCNMLGFGIYLRMQQVSLLRFAGEGTRGSGIRVRVQFGIQQAELRVGSVGSPLDVD